MSKDREGNAKRLSYDAVGEIGDCGEIVPDPTPNVPP
jgi:hypothetical protein